MIEAVLRSTRHPEYGEVSISFPILRKEYDHTIELILTVNLKELASVDEERNAYIMEKGEYNILLGTGSQETVCVADIVVDEEILVRPLIGDIGLNEANKGKIDFLKQENPRTVEKSGDVPRLHVSAADVRPDWPVYKGYDFSVSAQASVLQDVLEGRVSMEMFLNQMSVEELAVLCNGFGPGLPFGGLGKQAPRPDMGDVVLEASKREAQIHRAEKDHSDYLKEQEEGWSTLSIYADEYGYSGEEIIADEAHDVEAEAIMRIETAALQKALTRLDSQNYQLIHALYLADNQKTEREIAQELGVSQNAINKQKKKILKTLKFLVVKLQKSSQ